jgi:RHS repeat-associated protein
MKNPKAICSIVLLLLAISLASSGQIIYTGQNNDVFAEKIIYERNNQQNPNPQYNGNIGAVLWKSNDKIQNDQYNYDSRNQLKESFHFVRESNGNYTAVDELSVPLIEYDENGNIEELQRTDQNGGYKDKLTYHYDDANRLISLEELGDLTNGFQSGFTNAQYSYDGEGNMIQDLHKGIYISYNDLNLPDTISFKTNDSIIFFYDAEGIKYRKKVILNNGSVTNKYYLNGIEFNDSGLEAIYHKDGRAVATSNGFREEYVIRDHLGNSRVFFADLNNDGTIDKNSEIIQQNHYYPFGMKMNGSWDNIIATENNYQYNGKEFNGDVGFNWLDYGSRWYDPSIARWHAIDPKAEDFQGFSPYNYVLNHPTGLIDPDGEFPFGGCPDPPCDQRERMQEAFIGLTEFAGFTGEGIEKMVNVAQVKVWAGAKAGGKFKMGNAVNLELQGSIFSIEGSTNLGGNLNTELKVGGVEAEFSASGESLFAAEGYVFFADGNYYLASGTGEAGSQWGYAKLDLIVHDGKSPFGDAFFNQSLVGTNNESEFEVGAGGILGFTVGFNPSGFIEGAADFMNGTIDYLRYKVYKLTNGTFNGKPDGSFSRRD